MALAGFILGLVSVLAWILPIIGLPVTVVGLVLSFLSRDSISRRWMAWTGLCLCALFLVFTLVNSAAGVYLFTHRAR